METPPSLPPPQSGNKRLWIILAVVAAVLLIFVIGVVALGVFGFRRVQEKRAAARAATTQLQQTVSEERAKMADSIRKGEITGGDTALGRMKDQLEKSAGQLNDADAAAARAMAVFMGKMQTQVRDYQSAANRFAEAKVFAPTYTERAGIEAHRQIVRDFIAKNAQLADTLRRGEEMLRAELDAAKVPAKTRDATISGFTHSQGKTRPVQARIRDCDQKLGDTALSILDLFDKNWGKWHRDDASGQIVFVDGAALTAYNTAIERVQAAAAEQAQAQQELLKSMPAAKQP